MTGNRRTAEPQATQRLAALILAAGYSQRMGKRNKLLAEIAGQPMLAHVVHAVASSKATPVVVVTGHEHERVERALQGVPVRFVHNPNYRQGLSSSIRCGLRAIPSDAAGLLVCLGDMPRVTRDHIDRLIDVFHCSLVPAVVVPTFRGSRGNPVIFPRTLWPELAMLQGDVGARHWIAKHREAVLAVEMDDNAVLIDIDYPSALQAFCRQMA